MSVIFIYMKLNKNWITALILYWIIRLVGMENATTGYKSRHLVYFSSICFNSVVFDRFECFGFHGVSINLFRRI